MLRAIALSLLLALPAQAECTGRNLLSALSPADLAALRAKAEGPFAHGNYWTATKGDRRLTILGITTPDPRFAPVMEAISPLLDEARTLVVEDSPVWIDVLAKRASEDPTFLISTTRPTLREALGDDDFRKLLAAMTARGFPAWFVAGMKPWIANWWLLTPVCATGTVHGKPPAVPDLEKFLTDSAKAQGIPIRSLDDFDQMLGHFTRFPPEDQITRLKQAIAAQSHLDDLYSSAADAYFAGESAVFLEYRHQHLADLIGIPPATFARQLEEAEADFQRALTRWVPVLDEVTAKGPAVLSISAYDLSGAGGLLATMVRQGWTVTKLEP